MVTKCPICQLSIDSDTPHRQVDDCVAAIDAAGQLAVDEVLRRLLDEKHRKVVDQETPTAPIPIEK